ncbi:SDR family oxidoreductase [Rhodococcus gordoniae]
MARIALFGGHGKVALHLERLLAAAGHETSAFIRNPDHADDVRAAGATPVVADVEKMDIAEMTELLRGHDAVVWSAGAGGGNPERTYAVDRDAAIASMTAAQEAGVRRYVMVSYFGARPDHGVPEDNSFYAYAEAKSAADTHLRGTDLDWTILGPSALTLDPPTGRIQIEGHGARDKGQVSRADVAAVAAAVLELPETVGRTIEFDNGDVPIDEALDALR